MLVDGGGEVVAAGSTDQRTLELTLVDGQVAVTVMSGRIVSFETVE
ncbi:MAG: hypothetical protein ACLFU7_10565 [Armatimonadota bacterium]